MTTMPRGSKPPPSLHQVLDEVRDLQPQPDWARIEAAIFCKIEQVAPTPSDVVPTRRSDEALSSSLPPAETLSPARSLMMGSPPSSSLPPDDARSSDPRTDTLQSLGQLKSGREPIISLTRATSSWRRPTLGPSAARRMSIAVFALASAAVAVAGVGGLITAARTRAVKPAEPQSTLSWTEGHTQDLRHTSLQGMGIGAAVVAGAEGGWLTATGRLQVHLEPHTHVRVLDAGQRIRLALDHGTVQAAVVPVPGGEPFAVDVDGRRVAVHGTHLAVTRSTDGIEVAVSEGVAVVGVPVGERTEGTMVAAGSWGKFSNARWEVIADTNEAQRRVERALSLGGHSLFGRDGSNAQSGDQSVTADAHAWIPGAPVGPPHALPLGTDTVFDSTGTNGLVAGPSNGANDPLSAVPPTGNPSSSPVAARTQDNDHALTKSAANDESPPQPGLSEAQLAPLLARLDNAIRRCAPHRTSGVVFTIESNLHLEIQPTGAVAATFDPPLDTRLRDCVYAQIAEVKFPPAPRPTVLGRKVVLGGT